MIIKRALLREPEAIDDRGPLAPPELVVVQVDTGIKSDGHASMHSPMH